VVGSDVGAPVPAATDAPPALCSDGRRSLVAFVPALVVPCIVGVIVAIVPPLDDWVAVTVVLGLLGWNVFVIVYVLLTHRTFGGLDRDQFERRMQTRGGRRRRRARFDPRGDGPTFAVESALVAFGVVLILPHIDSIEIDEWVLVPVSLSILLSCWVLSVVSYALHYAQHDLAEPGLEYPGDRTNAWGDYLYFSIAVATTFGATDVNITTPRMRRVVNLHTILTFVYNSVIVALLAALLIR
jgi:uncharacterized membrane protein